MAYSNDHCLWIEWKKGKTEKLESYIPTPHGLINNKQMRMRKVVNEWEIIKNKVNNHKVYDIECK